MRCAASTPGSARSASDESVRVAFDVPFNGGARHGSLRRKTCEATDASAVARSSGRGRVQTRARPEDVAACAWSGVRAHLIDTDAQLVYVPVRMKDRLERAEIRRRAVRRRVLRTG